MSYKYNFKEAKKLGTAEAAIDNLEKTAVLLGESIKRVLEDMTELSSDLNRMIKITELYHRQIERIEKGDI